MVNGVFPQVNAAFNPRQDSSGSSHHKMWWSDLVYRERRGEWAWEGGDGESLGPNSDLWRSNEPREGRSKYYSPIIMKTGSRAWSARTGTSTRCASTDRKIQYARMYNCSWE